MPVPSLVTDLSTTQASNYPAGSDNVFPSLDDTLRALSAFIASIRDNSGNGWVSPYLPLAGGTVSGPATFSSTVALNGALSGTGLTTYLASPPAIGGTAPAAGSFTSLSASGTVSGTGFSNYLASPPAIGGTAAAAVSSTNLSYTGTLTGGTGVVNLGSGQFYKDASGNVGIGTSSPGAKLDVNGNVNASNYQILGSVASQAGTIGFLNANGPSIQFWGSASANAGDLVFNTVNAEKMRLDTEGDLGIGTGDPQVRLHVSTTDQSTARLRLQNTGTGGTTFDIVSGNPGVSNAGLGFYDVTNAATRMYLDSSGNLGIGTTPSTRLHAYTTGSSDQFLFDSAATSGVAVLAVRSVGSSGTNVPMVALRQWRTSFTTTDVGQIRFDGLTSTGSYFEFASVYASAGTNTATGAPTALLFKTSDGATQAQTRMTLDSSGNLGISQTAPNQLLCIGSGTSSASAPTYTGYLRLGINGTQTLATNSGLEFVASTFGSGYGWRLTGNDLGGGSTPFVIESRAGSASWSERLRITSGGDVGIGTTAPQSKMEIRQTTGGSVVNALTLSNYVGASVGTGVALHFDPNGAGSLARTASIQSVQATSGNYADLRFFVSNSATPAEAARITSGGDLLVGDTATAAYFDGRLNVAGRIHNKIATSAESNYFWNQATSGDNQFFSFGTEAAYTARGSISYNRAGGLVAYNTTSDYRAKDIIGPVQNPGATIDALKVYEGKMKGATQSRPMLVAHEAQEHAPYAVSGVKDEVNEDGTPKYQQMDVSSLVPLLLAEIQSLRARVAALEA